jgi:hypothetical protein
MPELRPLTLEDLQAQFNALSNRLAGPFEAIQQMLADFKANASKSGAAASPADSKLLQQIADSLDQLNKRFPISAPVSPLHPAMVGTPEHEKEKKRLRAIASDPEHKQYNEAVDQLRKYGLL